MASILIVGDDSASLALYKLLKDSKYVNVGTVGHVDHDKKPTPTKSLINAVCVTGHEPWFQLLKVPKPDMRPINRETWRGKGKQRMPNRGRN